LVPRCEPLDKPARMHWARFEQLAGAADQADFGALGAIARRFRLGGP